MIMVKPATFHTTMAMIDQKAGWKVARRLNFFPVRPRSKAAGLNRPESTLSSHDQSRHEEGRAVEAGEPPGTLDEQRQRKGDGEDRDRHHHRVEAGEAQRIPEPGVAQDRPIIIEADVAVLAHQRPVVQRHPRRHAERDDEKDNHQRHGRRDIEQADPLPAAGTDQFSRARRGGGCCDGGHGLPFPSPLVGEGGSARSAETDEGCAKE
jgi:hypothetical protein